MDQPASATSPQTPSKHIILGGRINPSYCDEVTQIDITNDPAIANEFRILYGVLIILL